MAMSVSVQDVWKAKEFEAFEAELLAAIADEIKKTKILINSAIIKNC